MKVSDLTGEQVEITGAAKRLLAEQAEKEQEMVAIQNGTNEEGAANLERLAEVRQRRAEAAAKRAEETVRPDPPALPTFRGELSLRARLTRAVAVRLRLRKRRREQR